MKTTSLMLLGLAVTCGACAGETLDPIVKPAASPAPGATTPETDAGPTVPSTSGDPIGGVVPEPFAPSASCAGKETFPTDVVIGCNFPPSVAVLGATSSHVVVMTSPDSGGWRIVRIARATAKIEELDKGTGTTYGLARFKFGKEAGTVSYAGTVDVGGGFTNGLYEIDVAAAKKRLLVDYGVYNALLSTATHVFFQGENDNPGFRRAARSGGAPTLVASTHGNPIRVLDGHLYFAQTSASGTVTWDLKRVPEAGGTPEDVATNLETGPSQIVVDDDGTAYFVLPEAYGWRVVRAQGTARSDVFRCANPELCGLPHALMIYGDNLFVRESETLIKIAKSSVAASPTQGALAAVTTNLPAGPGVPWLEGTNMIAAYTYGGIDAPSEGIVVVRKIAEP